MAIQVDIKPTGTESAVVSAPFDQALSELESNSYKVISIPQNAQLRIKQGKDHYVSRNGNWVREGVIYVPNGKNYFVRNSPILGSAKKATQAHREGKEFFLTEVQVAEALKDSIEYPQKDITVPTKRLGDEELTVFAIGGGDSAKAQAYGDFLKEAGIKEIPFWAVTDRNYINKQTSPFARQVWFRSLGSRSDVDGSYWDLNRAIGVRGVRSVSGEASAQNISQGEKSEPYSPTDLRSVLNSVGITGGIEKTIFEALNQRKH